MYTSRVQVDLEEWPEDRWIIRTDPFGIKPFVIIETEDQHPLENPEELDQIISITLGGGLTARNLARILRGIADLVEEQNARYAA